MRGVRTLIFVALAMLAGCCEDNKVERNAAHIRDVSFAPEHREGVKPAHTVPDRWFLNVCDDGHKDDCSVRTLEHAPWDWQQQGQPVIATWKHDECSGWRMTKFEKPETP